MSAACVGHRPAQSGAWAVRRYGIFRVWLAPIILGPDFGPCWGDPFLDQPSRPYDFFLKRERHSEREMSGVRVQEGKAAGLQEPGLK